MGENKAAEAARAEFVRRLEEDDEFEDFPQDSWGTNGGEGAVGEADGPAGAQNAISGAVGATGAPRLWEESWEDHDDNKDEFTARLRDELAKTAA